VSGVLRPRDPPDDVVRRPVADFPRLRAAVEELDRALRARVGDPGPYFVYGSYVRGSLSGQPVKDVDLAAGSPAALRRLVPLRNQALEMREVSTGRWRFLRVDLNQRPYRSAAELLRLSDFTVTRMVCDAAAGAVHLAPGAFEHAAARVLVAKGAATTRRVHILFRTYKYLAAGYRVTAPDLEQLLEMALGGALRRRLERAIFVRRHPDLMAADGRGPRW
jgi:hypothetical protein